MVLFIGLYSFYFLLMVVASEFVDFKKRNAFFWGLITFVFTPLTTIIFMQCLGDSKRKKEEKVTVALRNIALIEFDVLCNSENNHCLSRYRDLIIAGRAKRKAKKEDINEYGKDYCNFNNHW